MKRLPIYLSLFVLISCSHTQEKTQIDSLVSQLTPEELIIHQCLSITPVHERNVCLKGTSFESEMNRAPSSDLVRKLDWFFNNQLHINTFLKTMKHLMVSSKQLFVAGTKKLIDHRGVGIQGDVFAGAAVSSSYELASNQGVFGLFCSIGVGIATDVGAQASLYVTQGLDCTDNDSYTGAGVGFGAGMNGSLIGLPVDVGLSYSLSLDAKDFAKKLRALRQDKKINFKQLAYEAGVMSSDNMAQVFQSDELRFALSVALQTARVIEPTIVLPPVKSIPGNLKKVVTKHKSLSALLTTTFNNPKFMENFDRYNLPNAKLFFQTFASALSTCDNLYGNFGVGVSLLPASISFGVQNSAMIWSITQQDFHALGKLGPLSMLHPYLIEESDLHALGRVAKTLIRIPATAKAQCGKL